MVLDFFFSDLKKEIELVIKFYSCKTTVYCLASSFPLFQNCR